MVARVLRAFVGGLLAALLLAASGGATSADTSWGISIKRGEGTELTVTLTNKGPSPTVVQNGSSGIELTLDCHCSGAIVFIDGEEAIEATKGWTCGGSGYDVLVCSKKGAFGVGETLTVTFSTTKCYPANHAHSVAYFTSDQGSLNGHIATGTFQGPTANCTDAAVRVGTLRVALSERLKRLAKELQPRVEALLEERQELEADLPGLRTRLAKASEGIADFDEQAKPLAKQVEETKSFLVSIGTAQRSLPAAAEAQARDSLDRRMATLRVQIIQAVLAGDGKKVATLDDLFAANERQLANLERALAGKEGKADELRDRWLATLRSLNDRLFALERKQAEAEHDRSAANDALLHATARLGKLDLELTDLAARLSALDFGIDEITVFANGEKVFEASAKTPYVSVKRLDAEIREVEHALVELNEARLSARQQYLDQQKEVRAALQKVTDTIMSVAYKKAGVDFAYNAWDVVKAARQGGLVGAGAETAKKVVETVVNEYVVNRGPGKFGSEGAKELDAEYAAKIRATFESESSLPKAKEIAGKAGWKALTERTAKQTITSSAKDYFNRNYGEKVFRKLYGDLPGLTVRGVAQPRSGAAAHVREWLAGFRNHQAHLREFTQQWTGAWKFLRGQVAKNLKPTDLKKGIGKANTGELAGKLVEDVSKNLAKAYFDLQEEEAWAAYYEADVPSHMFLALWLAASDKYWKLNDELNALRAAKDALSSGEVPDVHTKVTLDKKFAKRAALRIVLDVSRPGGSTDRIEFEVKLAGAPAAHGGGYAYTLGAAKLKATPAGLGLQIVAR